MKIVCISDTHLFHRWMDGFKFDIPDGDVLVHAGDALARGSFGELPIFRQWFLSLPHKHKIFVPGNHDICFQDRLSAAILGFPCVLLDSGTTIEGVKFWGSPWQPEFCNWAFNLPRGGPELQEKWALIPDDTDVLITHGPPYGILDRVHGGEHVGCEHLLEAVARVQPKVHVFGHIHSDPGMFKAEKTVFVNAATCNEKYYPVNPPIVVEV